MIAGTTRALFLSYRREEARHIAGRLADRLSDRLGPGQVFMDVETIEPGADFATVIAREVGSCTILIALIGPTWATTTNQQGRRRLDDSDDFVVLEVRAALERGIPVIPVLVDGARMPDRSDLPGTLQGLRRRQAVRLDHDTFRSDVTVLLNAVDRILSTSTPSGHRPTRPIATTAPRSPVPQRVVRRIRANQERVYKEVHAVAFSPDGHLLASGSEDRTVRLWDPATGKPVSEPFTGHTGPVMAVAFSPDGHLLASGGQDRTVRLWDPATGKPVGQPLCDVLGDYYWGRAVAFSPDGHLLAGGIGPWVSLWDPATGRKAGWSLHHDSFVMSVAFSPDGHLLASTDWKVRLWEPATGQLAGQPLSGHIRRVMAVAFSPDGHLLAGGGDDGTVRLWDPATGQPVGEPFTGHTGPVMAVAFSPDGHLLASGGNGPDAPHLGRGDRTVRLWDPATGQPVGEPLTDHTDGVTAVAFSPDGHLLASGGEDGSVRLWGR